MDKKINELIKRYQERLDNLLKKHDVSDVMDIDKVVDREEGRILRDIIKELSELQNKEKTDWICKDCNGVFFGDKITCTCGHGIYKDDIDGETLRQIPNKNIKTIQDLESKHINKIYSLIMGENRSEIAGKIEWTKNKSFVIAIFKVEKCTVNKEYETIEYGIEIDEKLNVNHVWLWKKKKGTAIESHPLYNHHKITKYLIDEGFEL